MTRWSDQTTDSENAGNETPQLKIVKGTGHVALTEAPEEFANICLDFLRSLPPEGSD